MRSNVERMRTLRLSVAVEDRSPTLGPYYVSFRNWVGFVESGGYGPLDENGIPLVDYSGHAETQGIGTVYFAVTVAQYALGNFDLWLETRSEKYRQKFLQLAAWLERNAEAAGKDIAVWPAKFDFPVYGLRAPWISSLSQSQVVSVLLRAYQVDRQKSMLSLAERAFQSFFVNVPEPGGVRYVERDGDVWFEEYVTDPPAHVLNGFIFSLFGLLDYARATGDDKARQAWERGVLTLERKLHLFDTGFWSRYDLLRDCVASEFYHVNIHVPLLRALSVATGKETFSQFARRWERYSQSWLCKLRARYYRFPFRVMRRLVRFGRVRS